MGLLYLTRDAIETARATVTRRRVSFRIQQKMHHQKDAVCFEVDVGRSREPLRARRHATVERAPSSLTHLEIDV